MHVVDMAFYWARTAPHRPAIVQPEMITTFQGLADAIVSISDRIDRLGLDTREPIAVALANPSYFVATAFAALRCGYSVALVQASLFPQLQPAGIRNLIYDTQGLVLSGGRNIRFDASWLPAAAPTPRKFYPSRPIGDVGTIAFTSGTTGLPKKHMLRKAAFEYRFGCPLTSCANGDHKSALIMPGVASGFGFNRACELLFAGKAACFAPYLEDALWLMNVFAIEALVASPAQAVGLAELQEAKARYPMTSLRSLRIGGATLPPALGRKLQSNLCRNIILSYASTEAGTAASASYDIVEGTPEAVGFIGPDVDLEIVDEAGTVLPAGSEGIIRLRTPQFALNADAAGPSPPADGGTAWFYPGDIGRRTPDGMLCVSGRTSDVINSGGVKVSAGKIEEILQARPEIKEVAACGMTGSSGFEEVWIAIVAGAPVDVAEIKRLLREHREVGLVSGEVFVVDELPRGGLGKVQKHRLKERLLELKAGA